jgi:predicted nucleotidyltransferase
MTNNITDESVTTLSTRLAALFGELPQVVAVALGGSLAGGAADAASDIDLYVYTRAEIPVSARVAIVECLGGATRADFDQTYWGASDQWVDAATGQEIDAVYFDAAWMAGQLGRVLDDHAPSLGYTTAFWHTVCHSRSLHDPTGWFADQQRRAAVGYPEPLRRAIVAYNQPVLRGIITSYRTQIAKAVGRGDPVGVNHRLAALLASTFDILFAVNRVPHPGEKRLLAQAAALCPSLPVDFAADVTAVLNAAGAAPADLLGHLDRLLDRLDAWLTVAL